MKVRWPKTDILSSSELCGQSPKRLHHQEKYWDIGLSMFCICRCHYLVFNASVTYWQFCRPLMRLKWRHQLISSLQQVIQALDDVNDEDHNWRAELKMYVMNIHLVSVPLISQSVGQCHGSRNSCQRRLQGMDVGAWQCKIFTTWNKLIIWKWNSVGREGTKCSEGQSHIV